jgi:hypothetical protein
MFDLRQQLSEYHLGILHCIEINPPYIVVHYANFTKDDVREEIESKGKMMGNWIFYPL